MKLQLTDVRGVGASTARALEALGIGTVAALAKASAKTVAGAPGFGEARAAQVIAEAAAMLGAASKPGTGEVAPPKTAEAKPEPDEGKAAGDAAPSSVEAQAKQETVKAEKKKKKGKDAKKKKKKKGKKKKK